MKFLCLHGAIGNVDVSGIPSLLGLGLFKFKEIQFEAMIEC